MGIQSIIVNFVDYWKHQMLPVLKKEQSGGCLRPQIVGR